MLEELEIIYLVLTIPLALGVGLLGFGFSKMLDSNKVGLILMILGILISVMVGFAFWYFSDYFNSRINIL